MAPRESKNDILDKDTHASEPGASTNNTATTTTTTASTTTTANGSSSTTTTTKVYYPENGAPYIICNSSEPFVNPTTDKTLTEHPERMNQEMLNLDLGQQWITRKACRDAKLLWMIQFLDQLLIQWWEPIFHYIWSNFIPFRIRRALTFGGWKLYFPIHKALLGRKTGIHPSQSLEYHALTTIVWWSRFLPIPPQRMRFSLSQLHVCSPNVVPKEHVQTIQQRITISKEGSSSSTTTTTIILLPKEGKQIPPRQMNHCTVRGLFLNKQSDITIFWIYGGAYLAGDTHGNAAAADWVASNCNVNVFIPEFRLAPEANIEDVLWDVVLAYKWFVNNNNNNNNHAYCKDPTKVIVLGISSGGAIAIKLMQMIAAHQRGDESSIPNSLSCLFEGKITTNKEEHNIPMPMAAALFGPYIDYTDGSKQKGSFLHYARHDLIVNESVQEYGLPYLDEFISPNDDDRRAYSPVYGNMEGLPPMVVIVSEHECVYDMTLMFVNRCRQAGVPVTLGVWKYMCHVFSFFWAFCPEGQASMEFVCDWIKERSTSS